MKTSNPAVRHLGTIAIGTVACLTLAFPARAQTTFYPSVELGAAYNNNVQFGGADTEPVSDWTMRLGVTLPLERQWGGGTWRLEYDPAYDKHLDLHELDHMEHRLATAFSARAGRSGVFAGALTFTRTQEQGRATSLESPDLFLTRRTNRHFYSADLSFTKEVTARWRWGAAASAARYDYSEIENFDPGTPVAAVEDRDEYRASVNVSRLLTRADSLGFRYEHGRFDLETGEVEDVDLVGFTYGRSTGHDVTMDLQIGGYQRRTDPATGEVLLEDDAETGMQGSFSLSRAFQSTTLAFSAEVLPSSGGALEGTSTDASAGVTVSSAVGRRWSWSVSSRVAHRDPTDSGEEPVSSVGAGFGVEWRPTRNLGLRIGAHYGDQQGNTDDAFNKSFLAGGGGLVWYPRGYEREGRSGGV
jgi:hypothetical protein